jgi:hypothetical protein
MLRDKAMPAARTRGRPDREGRLKRATFRSRDHHASVSTMLAMSNIDNIDDRDKEDGRLYSYDSRLP